MILMRGWIDSVVVLYPTQSGEQVVRITWTIFGRVVG